MTSGTMNLMRLHCSTCQPYGLTWSLEAYEQANARLYRQGQDMPVIIHHIIAKDTVDEAIMSALRNKKKGQDALMEAVKAMVKEVGK